MPRVFASMADVTTDFTPIEPGIHEYEIEEVKEVKMGENEERLRYDVKLKVVSVIEPGNDEDVGRSWTDRIYVHKKDGDINEFGLAQLKRYFEVTVGEERANDPEADTDELHNQRFKGQTALESYEVTDNLTNKKETRKRNSLQRLAEL